jgi:hypothetical protein
MSARGSASISETHIGDSTMSYLIERRSGASASIRSSLREVRA